MNKIARERSFPHAGNAQRAGPGSARHAWAAGGGDPAAQANQHARAAEAGRLKDLAWFRCNPGRCYRIRRSLPFEDKTWGPMDHKEFRFMAVYASPDGSDYRRHAIESTKRPGSSEEFVRRLFERIENFEGEGLIFVSPDDHEADLRLTGEMK